MTWDVDDWGCGLYAVRGHVTAQEFAEAVAAFEHEGEDVVYSVKWIQQAWRRYIPDDEGGGYHEARAGSRGAFKVTVGEIA